MSYKITDECIACGTCVDSCPEDAISEGEPVFVVDQAKCTECGTCAEICPVDACQPGE